MDWLKNKVVVFHVHTRHSFDSLIDPGGMVDACIRNGVELLIITDHDTIDGALAAREYVHDRGFRNFEVIIGEEVSTDIGDIIGFPLNVAVPPGDFFTVCGNIKQQGGLVCLPHPYRSHDLFRIHERDVQDSIDFIETFNSRLNPKFNAYAEQLRLKFGKFALAGTDAHIKSDLCRVPFKLDDQMKMQMVRKGLTPKRNLRMSQGIGSWRKRAYLDIPKYIFLAAFNK
ncbi:MAG TPA: PHP domain-containing protein [Candidatus Kryptonia bacterium]